MSEGASQSEIAEGGSIVRASQLDNSQKLFDASSIVYNQLQPNTYGQAIVINNSNAQTTINVPSEVFNIGDSVISGSISIPAPTAGNYIWYYADQAAEIQHIQYFSQSNQMICDLDYMGNYYHVVNKKETSLSDYLTYDPLNRFSPSNCLVNTVPALRNSIAGGVSSNIPSPSSVNFTEPAYFQVGALGAAVTYPFQLPLRYFKNTFLEVQKSIYMPNISYMKIFFSQVQKVCYMSTSNASPSAGTPVAWAPLTGGNNVTVANLSLFLAVETNKNVRAEKMAEVMRPGGMKMFIPFTMCYRNSNTGTIQNINIPIDSGSGRSIRKIIHTIYNGTEQCDTAYDCSNIANGNAQNPQKALVFYTSYNSTRIQNLNIDTTAATGTFLDYLLQKRNLKGSVLQNYNSYGYNWYWEDDFSGVGSKYTQDNNNELVSGIPLSGIPVTWTFQGVTMAATNNSYVHYTYVTFTKELTITPQLVEVH